jgi:ABC-type multidrug transport system ATPase subunit
MELLIPPFRVEGIDSSEVGLETSLKGLGYCPQEDTLFPSLTVAETLSFYARISGYSERSQKLLLAHTLQVRSEAHMYEQMLAPEGSQ